MTETVAAEHDVAVAVTDLRKVYGHDVVAVNDVTLNVRSREFMTLLGPSGSGKTTLLKMLAGFLMPTSGTIRIGDRDVSRTPSHEREVGMVFQNYALFPHMTVAQNLAFPLEMRKVPRADIRRRIDQALDVVRLPTLKDRYPKQLSGGQQQRVALARAIIYEPTVLLMDEPLGALDKRLREDLQLEFKRLHQELDVTVLYVTHDQEEALLMSDRIAIFNAGKIEQLGTGEELYRQPRTTFVGTFMGESNLFRGTIRAVDGMAQLAVGDRTMAGTIAPDVSLSAGDAAALIVRPEACRVVASVSDEGAGCTALPATVEQSIYLGSSVKVQLNALGSTMFVRMNSGRSRPPLAPGASVVVEWDTADAVIVPDSAA
jgi:putative spermidine/putrescine transport system ATP-binding protein